MPDSSINLSPTTASEARGRNGWFKPASVKVHDWSNDTAKSIGWDFLLTVNSKRGGDTAPILLHLSKEDAVAIRDLLNEAVPA